MPNYSQWDQSRLIDRINSLEEQIRELTTRHKSECDLLTPQSSPFARGTSPKKARSMNLSKYTTRFIALKFAYLGQNYNGLEHANGNITPLPTIEEEIWKALVKCRLIFPPLAEKYNPLVPVDRTKPFSLDWDGCEYSKCGRTDRGVSAFGQVIGIRVRSARPKPRERNSVSVSDVKSHAEELRHAERSPGVIDDGLLASTGAGKSEEEEPWDDIGNELPYLQMLNNVLPEDIRVLAWCPHPPAGFDARFSCRERRYKYFFTQPAFSPTPGPLGYRRSALDPSCCELREGWLDIDAMRKAAKYLEGEHDFRNFCKVDPSKQIKNHVRKIYYANIEKLDPVTSPLAYLAREEFAPKRSSSISTTENTVTSAAAEVYTFTVHGSAFLWHQVRQMVGILFLIGQGLESPELVLQLLDVENMPRRPAYDLASDVPLVLWDTVFPDERSGSRQDALDWVYAGDPRTLISRTVQSDGKFGRNSTVDKLWSVWRKRKMDEILAGTLLNLVVEQGDRSSIERGGFLSTDKQLLNRHLKTWNGGNSGKVSGKYVPVMQKPRTDTPEEINARYAAKKEKKMAGKAAAAVAAAGPAPACESHC
ncbi:hypothetical protein KEM54_006107 [Ascosphaera aggregata]|nr:hypothetical protein KEM54_006107 [Ascosphaera aggregata]